jgi:dihydroorotase
MSSDFAWGIWNKIRGPFYRTEIRKIMTLYIVNPETIDILRRALAKHDVSEIKRWPGTEIDPKTEEGLAILGKFAPLFDAS